jgi:hypothetical protein
MRPACPAKAGPAGKAGKNIAKNVDPVNLKKGKEHSKYS